MLNVSHYIVTVAIDFPWAPGMMPETTSRVGTRRDSTAVANLEPSVTWNIAVTTLLYSSCTQTRILNNARLDSTLHFI
jgi:hypothetical protein